MKELRANIRRRRRSGSVAAVVLLVFVIGPLARAQSTLPAKAADAAKPVVACFPIGGNAPEALRDKVGFSLRSKLDRDGTYEVIDGPRMSDLAALAPEPIAAETRVEAVRELGDVVEATLLLWGELNNSTGGPVLRLKILDLREAKPEPREMTKTLAAATDLRFVSEEILRTLPGVKPFEHVTEVAVTDDAESRRLWEEGQNLVENPDFAREGHWEGIYRSEQYPVAVSRELPPPDKVVIHRSIEADGTSSDVLAMNLSREAAETNGLACLSSAMPIQADRRYRLSFRYRSDGPVLHVFVKGYTQEKDINGQPTLREVYRRQVPVTGKTNGKWVTIVDDLNPQHVVFPVQFLRIDLYAYLQPGTVFFDDVILKDVGKPTRNAKDAAIDQPVTRPSN